MVSAGHGARLALTVSGGVQDKEEAFLIFPFRATARRANARAAAAALPHEARVHGVDLDGIGPPPPYVHLSLIHI